MYLVSACLAGINCRYNGSNTKDKAIKQLVLEGKAIPVCPEVLGGLSIPRAPCEIVIKENGEKRVINRNGEDITKEFQDGALKTLKICEAMGIKEAILQTRSPSCGHGKIYDGTFSGYLTEGKGITAELLEKNRITVHNEKTWNK